MKQRPSSPDFKPWRRGPIVAAIATLALSLGVTLPASAQSSVTLNGVADLAVRHVKNDGGGAMTSLVSGSNATSRLVFRGQEDLGGGMAAGFHLEMGIAMDTGSTTAAANAMFDRRATVSLQRRGWGELRLGRDFVPSYVGWSRFDPFAYVGAAGSTNLVSATPQGPIRSAFGTNPNTTVRSSNALQYFLPGNLGGVEGQLMAAVDEAGTAAEGRHKVWGGRLGWSGGPVSVSVGHTVSENDLTAKNTFEDTVAGGSVKFGAVRAHLAWRQFKQNQSKQTLAMLAGTVDIGASEFKASLTQANLSGRVGNTSIGANDATQLGLGYVYNLSRRSAVYATYSQIENKGAATFAVPGGLAAVSAGQSSKGVELGLRQVF